MQTFWLTLIFGIALLCSHVFAERLVKCSWVHCPDLFSMKYELSSCHFYVNNLTPKQMAKYFHVDFGVVYWQCDPTAPLTKDPHGPES